MGQGRRDGNQTIALTTGPRHREVSHRTAFVPKPKGASSVVAWQHVDDGTDSPVEQSLEVEGEMEAAWQHDDQVRTNDEEERRSVNV